MESLPRRPWRQSLGRSDLNVSAIAYGYWRFAGTSVREARAKVETALELGINLMDHADIYGVDGGGRFGDAERLFGEVLKEAPALRDQMVLATKGGIILGVPYSSSASYLREAVEASLRRLQVDVIDLYQIHRPDFLTHPQEVAEALSALRAEGKIKEVGVSNYLPSQVSALQAHLSFPIVSHQPEMSCWRIDSLRDGVLDQCMSSGMTPLAWSPLAGGRLGMSVEEASTSAEGERLAPLLRALDEIAREQSVSRAAVAIAWVMAHPSRAIPILGTQRIDRLRDCLEAHTVRFTRTQWNAVLIAAQGEPLP